MSNGNLFVGDDEDLTPKPAKTKVPESVVDTWNMMAKQAQIPTCHKLTPARKRALNARWADPHWRENWQEAIRIVPTRPFLLGQNDRGWKANFDWFVRPGTVVKLMEGAYSGGAHKGGSRGFEESPEQVGKFAGK